MYNVWIYLCENVQCVVYMCNKILVEGNYNINELLSELLRHLYR